MSVCSKCGGKGKVYVDGLRKFVNCPDCNSIKAEVKNNVSEETQNIVKALCIPEEYEYAVYGYTRDYEDECKAMRFYSKESVESTLNVMDRIYESIENKQIIDQTFVFYVGNKYDEQRFVYSCQYEAVRKGLTTAPFVSINTIVALIKDLKGVNNRGVYDRFRATYIDYIESDYIFINVGAMITSEDECTLVDLMSERARRGLTTCIFSYWQPSYDRFKYVWGEVAKNSPLIMEFIEKNRADNKNKNKNIDQTLDDFENTNGNKIDIDML